MKILVTGATGFIGGHVIAQLLEQGHEVIASGATPSLKLNKHSWINKVEYIPWIIGTETNENLFSHFNKPNLLIHLAWGGLPNYNSLFHFEKNLPEQYLFLKNLIIHGLSDITISGTCFEYGIQEGCLSESMNSSPTNSYALAKDSLRKFLDELQKHQPFVIKWLRLFYMYGKDQSANSLIPQLLQAFQNGESHFNMSPGDQVRDYLPVETMAKKITAIALQKKITGVINCCSGKPVKVIDFVREFAEEHDIKIELNTGFYPYSPIEPFSFWGDTTKMNLAINNS
jgi:nucleoside-diphosphate-sugar epimerase